MRGAAANVVTVDRFGSISPSCQISSPIARAKETAINA